MIVRDLARLMLLAVFFFAMFVAPGDLSAGQKNIGSSSAKVIASTSIFSSPKADSAVIGSLNKDETVTVLGKSGNYFKIKTSRGQVGYVKAKALGVSNQGKKSDHSKKDGKRKKPDAQADKKKDGKKRGDQKKPDKQRKPKADKPRGKKDKRDPDRKPSDKEYTIKAKPYLNLPDHGENAYKRMYANLYGGLGVPFMEVFSPAFAIELCGELIQKRYISFWFTFGTAYVPYTPNDPIVDDPKLTGYWVPLHFGFNMMLFPHAFISPYIGIGPGVSLHEIDIIPQKTQWEPWQEMTRDRYLFESAVVASSRMVVGVTGKMTTNWRWILEGQFIVSHIEENSIPSGIILFGFQRELHDAPKR